MRTYSFTSNGLQGGFNNNNSNFLANTYNPKPRGHKAENLTFSGIGSSIIASGGFKQTEN